VGFRILKAHTTPASISTFEAERRKCDRLQQAQNDPIAIIAWLSISGGANKSRSLLELLSKGQSGVRDIP